MKFYERWLRTLKEASGKHGYTCDCCKGELYDYPLHRLCAACETRLERTAGYVCEKCGRKTVSEGVCLTCKSQLPLFDRGISPYVYRAETAVLVNRMKNGDRRLAFYFGEKMSDEFVKAFPQIAARYQGELLCVPVPLTKKRWQARGYNQAQELAEVVVARLALQGIAVTLNNAVLEKVRDGESQKDLSAAERLKNAVKSYRLRNRKAVAGKIVLLVDDVATTGATGSACARLLKRAGAACVVLLTVAALPER